MERMHAMLSATHSHWAAAQAPVASHESLSGRSMMSVRNLLNVPDVSVAAPTQTWFRSTAAANWQAQEYSDATRSTSYVYVFGSAPKPTGTV